MSKHAAIVGSGIGGLTSALLLTERGVKVTIYERMDRIGGRAIFEEEGPYRIDQGPTIVLLPDMLLDILEEGGFPREQLELLRCDPLYRLHFRSGRTLTKVKDNEAQAAEIERSFPGEGAGFLRFMRELAPLFPQGQKAILGRSFEAKRDFFHPATLLLLAKMKAYRSLRGVIGGYFRSEELKDAYSLQSLYIGGAPFRTPGIYSLLPYAEHAFGVWMLKGGYGQLPLRMAEELKRRGVTIHTGTEVESLIVEKGSCKGVVIGGKEHRTDAVLYNGDFPNLEGLLPHHALAERERRSGGSESRDTRASWRRKPRYQPSSGCLLIFAGARKRWPDSLTHQFFLPESLHKSLQHVFDRGEIPSDPSYYVFNPVQLDESAAPPGESVLYFLIPVPTEGIRWEGEAERLAERVLADAEKRGFEGLRDSLVWKKLRTPADALREGLYGGGSFGIAPVLTQSGVFRPQPKPYAIENLYAAGASVHPGGGIPIVMQGARLAVNQMLKEMKS
ncbi:phytoene desaturase family protein [Gorillibacterium sp. CAU 1737]|uniref:phytoene desaturase family protein n=1 Tax=Gorillibacterium sp. CAU 1737 TaxID=3140362 RepID=UPI00326069F9